MTEARMKTFVMRPERRPVAMFQEQADRTETGERSAFAEQHSKIVASRSYCGFVDQPKSAVRG